jgi:sigma-B regulation protein RsbU (phosphoserine phosphatase)
MTACYGMLNRKSKSMTIVNAGHPPPVYVPKGDSPRFVELTGDVLGIFTNVYFGMKEIAVTPGDRFFLYSDGLIERIDQKKVWTEGKEELLKHCEDLNQMPFEVCAERLSHLMLDKGPKPEDDVVVLGIEV